MKFLQLTKKFPYPPKDGESLLVSSFNKLLVQKGNSLDLLSFNTSKHFFDVSTMPEEENIYNKIHTVYLNNYIKIHEAFFNLFSKQPFHIIRFESTQFEKELVAILKNNQYDFILMESLNLAPYLNTIRKFSNAKIIFRAHNVEHEIWERITKNEKNPFIKLYLSYLTKKLKRYELEILNDFDYFIAITERDLKKYKSYGLKIKSIVIPAGITEEKYTPKPIDINNINSFSFLGSLDWKPNLEGLDWFVKNIWPEIIKKQPNSILHIAGRNTPDSINNLHDDNIKIHGEVPDSIEFLNSFPIMIVPLLSGGGMRLKILEALALGRITITTTVGLEGIDAENMKQVLIADTPEEFLDRVAFCQNNREKLKQISANAIQLFKSKYGLNNSVDNFLNFLQ